MLISVLELILPCTCSNISSVKNIKYGICCWGESVYIFPCVKICNNLTFTKLL
nr:MAG TPA: hypothetical protein [Caudoviricetes sp.]